MFKRVTFALFYMVIQAGHSCFVFFSEKAEPEHITTESGKGFTRKPPIEKARQQLEMEPLVIQPMEDGKN